MIYRGALYLLLYIEQNSRNILLNIKLMLMICIVLYFNVMYCIVLYCIVLLVLYMNVMYMWRTPRLAFNALFGQST